MGSSQAKAAALEIAQPVGHATEILPGAHVELAQWYWIADAPEDDWTEDGDPPEDAWLGCVTHIGSNYVEISSTLDSTIRIHADEFFDKCRLEPDASRVIEQRANADREEVQRLMGDVAALTARLGVTHAGALSSGDGAGAALAKLDPSQDVGKYKSDLVRAKEKDLPELFEKIETANESLARWMKAGTLPMQAQFSQMKEAIGHIDDRIFNVELYAGLTETVKQITGGAPAAMTEKIRLMQRRCYMDEECLAEYQTGGMEFADLAAFDAWLARPQNLDRILPFPRCVVAFQVRRDTKDRGVPSSFIEFFDVLDKIKADRFTFLYIRNGEQLYRMTTEVEFEKELFPDTDHHQLTSGAKLWATSFGGRIITDARYQDLREEYAAKKAKDRKEKAQHRAKLKAWRAAKKAAKAAGEKFRKHEPHFFGMWDGDPADAYEPFEPNNIYYDDIQKKIAAEIQQYNRIGIIIQGLLDRSPVLHPHPPWKIWSEGGFERALELIYDASRALHGGEKPDFEAYRQRLNKSLKTGSVTVGQQAAWARDMSTKENEYGARRSNRYYDDGPGVLARVTKYEPRKRHCRYAWHRESGSTYGKMIRTQCSCDADLLLNVDAYTPGDFRQFFADPRTRAEYLKWAPLLLEAEEFHAGNRKVPEPPEPVPRVGTAAGRATYRRRKQRERLVGKTVKLRHPITTEEGADYAAGTVWEVLRNGGGGLTVREVKSGRGKPGMICRLQPYDLIEVDIDEPGIGLPDHLAEG